MLVRMRAGAGCALLVKWPTYEAGNERRRCSGGKPRFPAPHRSCFSAHPAVASHGNIFHRWTRGMLSLATILLSQLCFRQNFHILTEYFMQCPLRVLAPTAPHPRALALRPSMPLRIASFTPTGRYERHDPKRHRRPAYTPRFPCQPHGPAQDHTRRAQCQLRACRMIARIDRGLPTM